MTFRSGLASCVMCALLVAATINRSDAAQPLRFNYQAKLSNSSGAPLQGSHLLYISLWDGGTSGSANSGTSVYSETASVAVEDGVVNHTVGTGTPTGGSFTDAIFASNNDIFLQVGVDSAGNVIVPRSRLESVPFARYASNGIPPGFATIGTTPTPPLGFTAAGPPLYAAWQQVAPLPVGAFAPGAAAANGRVYAMGGADGSSNSSKSVYAYDPVLNGWKSMAPMTVPRHYLTCTELNGLIYAVGGYSSTSSTLVKTNEAYDPVANTWTTKAPTLVIHDRAGAAAANGKLYIFGDTVNPNIVEEYDPVANSWTMKAPMPTGRYLPVAATVDGKIYVIGGDEGSSYVANNEQYDPLTDTWTAKAPLPIANSNSAAVAFGGKIYVTGGNTTATMFLTEPETRIYDPVSDSWSLGPMLSTVHSFHASAVLNGRIYVTGGTAGVMIDGTITEAWDAGVYDVYLKN